MEIMGISKDAGRVDKVLAAETAYTRSQLQRWLKEGRVKIGGKVPKANQKIASGEHYLIDIPEVKELELKPEDLPLEIVYEDDDVAVVNKPQGMVVHPAAGHPDHTLVNALFFKIKDLSGINGVIRPGIVHRIDKDTSGLLMVAKNDFAHQSLAAQLKEKSTQRKYVAIVHGHLPNEKGVIEAPIGRSKKDRKQQAVVADGRPAVTHFKVLEEYPDYSLIELQLETGRTHQIRVHMAYIGHPVAGDPLYGPKKTLKGHGQFLHARLLGFRQPHTGQLLVFEAPVPPVFAETLERLRKKS